ncbi:hypothetical protein K3495_g2633, partial [Podosphaera aphanis]
MSSQTLPSAENLAPFPLKLDRLPILTGSDNYRRWVGSWEISFAAMGLLKYLTGAIPEKSKANDYGRWEQANNQLRGLLLGAVDEPLQTIVIDVLTAKEAWDQLKARFDRETTNSTIFLLKNVTNLSLRDGESIPEYLTKFNDSWNRLRNRSQASETTLAKAFKDLTSSDDVKGAFLLSSLPKSMENIVENLVTKEVINYEGHLYTECRKLKAHQQKRKEKKNSAKTAQSTSDDHTEHCDTAFLAKFSSNSSCPNWIFDTGASAHMTGCSHDFETLTPLQNHSVKIA